jgi:hypothetical protein
MQESRAQWSKPVVFPGTGREQARLCSIIGFVERLLSRRETLVGRAPDSRCLIGRAKAATCQVLAIGGRTATTVKPFEVAWQLGENHYLVGYHESKGQEPDLMLRAVEEAVYVRWLGVVSYWHRAKSLRQRHKGNLITGTGCQVYFSRSDSEPLFVLERVGKPEILSFDTLRPRRQAIRDDEKRIPTAAEAEAVGGSFCSVAPGGSGAPTFNPILVRTSWRSNISPFPRPMLNPIRTPDA